MDDWDGSSTAGTESGAEGIDLTAELELDPPSAPVAVDLHDPRRRAGVEAAVAGIPGVLGARLVPGFERPVDELHVLTIVDRSAKQTVRDVQTVLMARFGIATDHRVVSVVQMDEAQGLPALASRPVIEEVGVLRSGASVEASVALRDGSGIHPGTAGGAATTTGRQRAVAHATLAAVGPLLDDSGLVELEGVEVVSLAGRELAVVLLQIRAARTELTLSGSAVVHDTRDDAIARAVLDGLNRTLGDQAADRAAHQPAGSV